MRFIDRLNHPPAPSTISEAVLLLIALRAITHERLALSAKEEALEAQLIQTLPGLRGEDEATLEESFARVVDRHLKAFDIEDFDAADLIQRQALLLELVSDLRSAPRELLRKRCFLLAVEFAFVGGIEHVTPGQDQILQRIYGLLGISPDVAHKIARVMSIKYAARRVHSKPISLAPLLP